MEVIDRNPAVWQLKLNMKRWSCKSKSGISLIAMIFISSSIPSVTPILPILTIIIQRKHILIALLAFEAIILSLTYILLFSTQPINTSELFLALILLSFGACEARLGLAALVAMTRRVGSDRISSLSLSKC